MSPSARPSRRRALTVASAVGASAALAYVFQRSQGKDVAHPVSQPGGALVPDPKQVLDLPAGFTYRHIQQSGDRMSDGYVVPGNPDGMGCFAGTDGDLILMRNHELEFQHASGAHPGQPPPPEAYSPDAAGAVTRVVLDAQGDLRSSNLVLTGTLRNCAGGNSPWGWLSCEEHNRKGHGYVFLCPSDAASLRAPKAIPGYGRFRHEAVAIDRQQRAYLTEDQGDSCLYRFVPASQATPFEGQLQALRIPGRDRFETGKMGSGEVLPVQWVDCGPTSATDDDLRIVCGKQGAATFVRGEGIWFFEDSIYICSTSGGPASAGQIFVLSDLDAPTQKLRLLSQSNDSAELEMPDNITVAPNGDVFICEDGPGEQYLRGIRSDGSMFLAARNAASSGELAGACFSPNGETLFVNLFLDGLTLAISGPFPHLRDRG